MVLDPENASGNVILSRKEANRVLVWDELKEDMADGTVFDVKRQSLPALLVMSVESVHLSRLHSLPSPMWRTRKVMSE